MWFRQDLRLADNPALAAAAGTGLPVLPVFILDDIAAGDWSIGGASRWWLHQSLSALNASLDDALVCRAGSAKQIIPQIASSVRALAVHCNDCIEPWQRAKDQEIAAVLSGHAIEFVMHRSATLFDPAGIVKRDGSPYRVFTPFYRNGCLKHGDQPAQPRRPPSPLRLVHKASASAVESLGLMPAVDWYRSLATSWAPGEPGALDRLERFLETGLKGYREGRNRPDQEHVSRLSPHLHFGEISPRQVWHSVLPLLANRAIEADVDCFMSEIGWREFSCYLLWHWPDLPTVNFQRKFDAFRWADDPHSLQRWQRGLTGIPMVDAGMRELWQTGYMHNRVRMIVGSFLVKNLMQHWHHGHQWFWDTLVDADLANNSASWQWIAGSGADAAPYFRIFNPVTQGQKFDPDGAYVRKYVPELAGIPGPAVHAPWLLTPIERAGLEYPEPVVDLKESRERALAAFREL